MFGGRADAKMLPYLVGAVHLELNLLSFAAHHFLAYLGEFPMACGLALSLGWPLMLGPDCTPSTTWRCSLSARAR